MVFDKIDSLSKYCCMSLNIFLEMYYNISDKTGAGDLFNFKKDLFPNIGRHKISF